MSDSSSERNPVEQLAEEFLERYRRGERPALTEYTTRYPDLAEQIHDLFPALVMMEDVRPAAGEATGDFSVRAANGVPKLQRLGDFRILREVGHGGMGVVYEAEQESLGRHVALKVLLTHSLLDPKQLQRFQREARSAARLHHTNIVPVYGVGENDGLHYYIMQYIQGQGLDQVLMELRHLRRLASAARKDAPADPPASEADARHLTAVAHSLLTGRFAESDSQGKDAACAETLSGSARAGVVLEGSDPERGVADLSARRHTGQDAGLPDSPSSSSIHLPGQADHSTLSHSSSQYFQSVARIGVQVADALAYAHGQGILHRDIKPSNLLLDNHGTVWVTDFGLAKAASDQDDLTHTGDIVGTLRYMAPERFTGKGEARSDLYSLGLTLYEMVALRPAFDEADRSKLIQQVLQEDPPRLRRLNPAVPRDLETIILKATARDPGQRYQIPDALADDLKRFLEDRPIRARRARLQERLWRWCRRNPMMAGLAAAVQIALVALLIVGAWSYGSVRHALVASNQALIDKNKALTDKETALTEKEAARADAVRLRDAAIGQSYRALRSEVEALRLAHKSGWRYRALQNLNNLARLDTPRRDLLDLRSEAVACLGEFDANEVARFVGHDQSVWSLDFSPDGGLLATAGYDGRVQVWDVSEKRQVREIIDPNVNLALRYRVMAPMPVVRFSPEGNSVIYATWPSGLGIEHLGATPRTAADIELLTQAHSLAFNARGNLLAVGGDGHVYLYDAATHALERKINTGAGRSGFFPVALNPAGELVAAMGPGHTVQLHTVRGAKEPLSLGKHKLTVRSLCFSPSGQLLASASEDHSVKLWDVSGVQEPLTLLGHTGRVNCVAFSPDGNLLASASDDQTVRLWETRNGQLRMVLQPRMNALLSVAFRRDGRLLAVGGADRDGVCLYELSSRQERLRLAGHHYMITALAFHPFKPLLASGSSDRSVILWNLQDGKPQKRWQNSTENPIHRIAFSPKGDQIAVGLGTFTTASGRDYAIRLVEPRTGMMQRRLLGPQSEVKSLLFDGPGKYLCAQSANKTFVWNAQTGNRTHAWTSRALVTGAAFLKNGARLILADYAGHVEIRDLAGGNTGAIVQERQVLEGSLVCFAVAPDEHGLVLGQADGTLRVVSLPDLKTTQAVPNAHAGSITLVAYSPDGRLVASYGDDRRVVLWNAGTYQPLAELPQDMHVHQLAFDGDGLRLAIGGTDELITLWNLSLVRPGLAAIGLDWNGPAPMATPQDSQLADMRPSQPVKTVRLELTPLASAPARGGPVERTLEQLLHAGRFREIIPLAEQAIKANPDSKVLYAELAEAYFHLGEYEKGIQAARRHLNLCPNCPWAVARLAESYAALSVPRLAIGVLEEALKTDPNMTVACNSLAWIYANGPPSVRDPEKALPLAQRAVMLGGNSSATLNTLGAVYYRLGKFAQAAETFQAPPADAPAPATRALNQLFLAMCYQRLGEPGKATSCYQRSPPLAAADGIDPYTLREWDAIRAEVAAVLGIK